MILFGTESVIYQKIIVLLRNYLTKYVIATDRNSIRIYYDDWLKNIFSLYEARDNKLELFIHHSYILLVINRIILEYLRLTSNNIEEIQSMKLIKGLQLKNNPEISFMDWIFHDDVKESFKEIIEIVDTNLSQFNFSNINYDIFRELYENIVTKNERHQTGEYYTPDWLAKHLTEITLSKWFESHSEIPLILDPACGSGIFLFYFNKLIAKYKSVSSHLLMSKIKAFDINPLAVYMTRANIILSMSPEVFDQGQEKLEDLPNPVTVKDSLENQQLIGFLSEHDNNNVKADILIGNPPWVVMRSLGNKKYQEQLKTEIFKYKLLSKKDNHLFTQMELSSLFFCKTIDIFLKKNGLFTYIMPKSVIAGTIHHQNFRKFENPKLKLSKIIDLHGVKPLFGMPSCVLFGVKGQKNNYPIDIDYYSLKINNKYANSDILELMDIKGENYSPPGINLKKSYYFDLFKVGASIFPRNFYFVDILKYDNNFSEVKTSEDITRMSKEVWKNVSMVGKIDNDYLYWTLLAWEMIPFGSLNYRYVVLPVQLKTNNYEMIDYTNKKVRLSQEMFDWFNKTNKLWKMHSTHKSKINFPNLNDRLNYNRLIEIQNPETRFVVLYGSTGTNLCCCVIDKQTSSGLENLELNFVVDVKTWFFETSNLSEAHYLCSILNSYHLNELIKPLQPQGLGGGRAIHRRPLMFPIPIFKEKDTNHKRLSDISIELHQKTIKIIMNQQKITRKKIRNAFKLELQEIDNLMEIILT